MKTARSQVLGVIPARYQSSRFPGKPLALLAGQTLIQRTYQNSLQASLFDHLVVATDDTRIFDHVISFGGRAVMTSPDCLTGTDRAAEVVARESVYAAADIIFVVQGDEPCVDPEVFTAIFEKLHSDPEAVMATAMTPIQTQAEVMSHSIVKCVADLQGNALYFSRAPIPASFQKTSLPAYRHIGIYAFRKEFLLRYAQLQPTPLQLAESLEQLKILEHGYRIKVALVDDPAIGVDTPEDISKVESLLCKRNSFLLPVASAPL